MSFALKRQIIDEINGRLALKNNLRYYSDPVSLSGPSCSKVDSSIHGINHYPVDNAISSRNTYPLDSDLSGG